MRKQVGWLLLLALPFAAHAQATARTLAERLGYPRNARILIVNADDLGMAHAIDDASLRALERRRVSSVSVMVPGPTFPVVAEYARAHPGMAMGLHLTLTSEWTGTRWGPVLPPAQVKSLVRPDSSFHVSAAELLAHVDPLEAEAELRAQIERAKSSGISPTHLDSHMAVMYQSPVLFELLVRLGRENGIPVRISQDVVARNRFMSDVLRPEDLVIDRRLTIPDTVPARRWQAWYEAALRGLQPGVTELIVHLGANNAELRAVTGGAIGWGSAWRGRDMAFFESEAFRRILRERKIILVSWADVARARPLQPER